MRKLWLHGIGLTAALAIGTPALAEAQGRYTGIDKNRDGVVTRAEWPGSDTSFRQHDRNRDGLLSGVEVRSEWRAKDNNGDKDKSKVKAKKPKKVVKTVKPHKHR